MGGFDRIVVDLGFMKGFSVWKGFANICHVVICG